MFCGQRLRIALRLFRVRKHRGCHDFTEQVAADSLQASLSANALSPAGWHHSSVASHIAILSRRITATKRRFCEDGKLQVVDSKWSQRADLNRGPTDYESVALPTELRWLSCCKQRA